MYTIPTYTIGGELYHHGILGQKWGQRNGPPYPLGKGKHSKREKDMNYTKSIKKGRANKADKKGQTKTTGKITNYSSNFSNENDPRFLEVDERVMPDGRIIFPPIAKVIGEFAENGKNPYPREKTGFEGVYDEVNPNYGERGTTNNCPFVGAAVEIRSRGYDVVARRSLGGASAGMFRRWFKGAENELCESVDELKQDILNDGDGSSGVLGGYYGDGLGSGQGGHTLHWRNENGEIKVIDGQNHTEWDFDDVWDQYGFNPGKCIRTRLDNHEPNWDTLAEDGVLGLPETDKHKRKWKLLMTNQEAAFDMRYGNKSIYDDRQIYDSF